MSNDLTIASTEAEHHNLYLLISFDIGSQFPDTLEDKIIPFITNNRAELFAHTRKITVKYAD